MTYDEMVSELTEWMRPYTGRHGPEAFNSAKLRFERRGEEEAGCLVIATTGHVYSISFAEGRYLGCVASSRIARSGENWLRGNDLPDGPFSRETFDDIIRAIVGYELVKLDPPVVSVGIGEVSAVGPSL